MDKKSADVPKSNSVEFYKKYRPKKLEDVVGQSAAVKALSSRIAKDAIPHAILLTGPSGTGKTTIARILRKVIGCSSSDYHEKDCTREEKPLDFVRELARSVNLRPMVGDSIVWFLEEFQSLSRAGFSQQALLKLLEDTPSHVYFILATTDASKLNKAIHTRCYELRLTSLDSEELDGLLQKVAQAEGLEITEEIREAIIEAADGSARKALVILEQICSLDNPKEQMAAIEGITFTKAEAFKLAQALMFPKGGGWNEIATILRQLADDDAEGIRYCVLGFARSCLIGKDKGPNPKLCPRAYMIIDIFSKNFYDSKHAGLAAASWEVMENTK